MAGVALAACLARAQPPKPYYFPEEFDEKPWVELKTQLPPYPKPENLVRFVVSASTSFEFLIDLSSISVGSDGVVRYSLVARSPSGATNVSFEGIKCLGRERKLYAFGRSDGTWSEARDPRWVQISGVQANRQHATLADDFFCPGRRIVRNATEAADALKRGMHPSVQSGER